MQPHGRSWRDRVLASADSASIVRLVAVAVPALATATGLVWLLEQRLGVLNAAPVYLLAVVATALVSGTLGALAAAVAGVLLYDFLFVHPLHTLAISDPGEWLNLVLLLFVAVVVGQLTALERSRAVQAEAREHEARELFVVSRALATRSSTTRVLPETAEQLRRAAHMTALWFALGPDAGAERVAALAGAAPPPGTPLHWVLRRTPGDDPAHWIRIHTGGTGRARGGADRNATFRIRIEAGGRALGSIWATRDASGVHPDRSETRLLSAAADQVGQALAQDQLAADAAAAEVARQSDALKSALLQSVSHDLRTPLATIRAAAGSLHPRSDLDEPGRAASAEAIEREVARLDRIVANLLDLGRIEAGALRAEPDVFELDDLAARTIDRIAPRLEGRDLRVELAAVPVFVDPVFLDEALTNLLDNAVKFAGADAPIRVRSTATAGRARLVVEDGGPGVPDDALERVFEPFHREVAARSGDRAGTGIGLAVVRGLVAAMDGSTRAFRSQLGGFAVELSLPLANLPPDLAAPGATAAPGVRTDPSGPAAPATPA